MDILEFIPFTNIYFGVYLLEEYLFLSLERIFIWMFYLLKDASVTTEHVGEMNDVSLNLTRDL